MASNFYREKDKPEYTLGHGLELGFVAVGLLAVTGLRFNYNRINGKRVNVLQSGEFMDTNMSDKGDRAPTFRYVL